MSVLEFEYFLLKSCPLAVKHVKGTQLLRWIQVLISADYCSIVLLTLLCAVSIENLYGKLEEKMGFACLELALEVQRVQFFMLTSV